jgi:hypothetical protein
VTVASVAGASSQATLTATIDAPVGLRLRSAPGAVTAIYADAPVPAVGSVSVPLSAPTNPTIAVTMSSRLALVGSLVSTTITAGGLNGQQASVVVAVVGPLPLDPTGGCGQVTPSMWSSALTSDTAKTLTRTTSTSVFEGDASVAGPTLTASSSGCYSASAQLTTTNLTPNLSATANLGDPQSVVAVSAVTVTVRAAPGGVAQPGPVPATVTVAGAAATAVSGTVSGSIHGTGARRFGILRGQ